MTYPTNKMTLDLLNIDELYEFIIAMLNCVLFMTISSFSFLFSCRSYNRTSENLPSCAIVIPCYLPNEENIIMNTLNHALNESSVQKVVLVYNTNEKTQTKHEKTTQRNIRHNTKKSTQFATPVAGYHAGNTS